jgi:hypothetical protein
LIAAANNARKIDIWLVAAVGLVHALMFSNAWRHDPRVGYDSFAHLSYIEALARGHLVRPKESYEFFSPPLPYALPALLMATAHTKLFNTAKIAQFIQVFVSAGLFLFLIGICRLINNRSYTAVGAVVFLGILPVYYKTFAFVRGEPYETFFAVAASYFFLRMFLRRGYGWTNIAGAGVAIGCGLLSRQWMALLLPAFAIFAASNWARQLEHRRAIIKAVIISFAIAGLISSWFYFGLKVRYGAATVSNAHAKPFCAPNHPPPFYFGLSPQILFTCPLRPNFTKELLPTFYSETWGDYLCYFLVWARDTRKNSDDGRIFGPWLADKHPWRDPPPWLESNYIPMAGYLGRVNLVSLPPTAFAFVAVIAALIMVARRDRVSYSSEELPNERLGAIFILLLIASAAAGFLWWITLFPVPNGSAMKATYVLHLFPFVAVLVGLILQKIADRKPVFACLIMVVFVLVAVHNLGAMLTHYS